MSGRPRPALAWLAALATAVLLPLALAHPASADPTPPALGGDMMDCYLPNPAFCENFSSGPYTGTAADRGGDLDPAQWSMARETEGVNPPQGLLFAEYPATAQFCQTPLPGVLPDRDSFMCDGTDGTDTTDRGTEDMHWMTAMDDGGNYAVMGARALQPFDFAGRTGTVAFMVDAATRGSHSTWPGVTLSADPVNSPHGLHPGVDTPPRDGFELDFNAGCGTPAQVNPADGAALSDYPATTVGDVRLFTDYQERTYSPQQLGDLPCVAALADHPNLIVLQVSATSLDVWMADAIANMTPGVPMPPPPLTHVLHLGQAEGWGLGMTRGYLSFQQSQYNAAKFNGSAERTYHWHAIGFDGPALAPDLVGEVPDSLAPAPGGAVNVGYLVPGSRAFAATLPDAAAGRPGYLSLDWRGDADARLTASVNGAPPIAFGAPPGGGGLATGLALPIPAGVLRPGANTIALTAPPGTVVANVDLGVPGDGSPAPEPSATATATATPAPTATASPPPTASPSATATADPTDTPTPQPSATGTPGPLWGIIAGQHFACVSHDGGQSYECVRP